MTPPFDAEKEARKLWEHGLDERQEFRRNITRVLQRTWSRAFAAGQASIAEKLGDREVLVEAMRAAFYESPGDDFDRAMSAALDVILTRLGVSERKVEGEAVCVVCGCEPMHGTVLVRGMCDVCIPEGKEPTR